MGFPTDLRLESHISSIIIRKFALSTACVDLDITRQENALLAASTSHVKRDSQLPATQPRSSQPDCQMQSKPRRVHRPAGAGGHILAAGPSPTSRDWTTRIGIRSADPVPHWLCIAVSIRTNIRLWYIYNACPFLFCRWTSAFGSEDVDLLRLQGV